MIRGERGATLQTKVECAGVGSFRRGHDAEHPSVQGADHSAIRCQGLRDHDVTRRAPC
jgi:hypothetical protein